MFSLLPGKLTYVVALTKCANHMEALVYGIIYKSGCLCCITYGAQNLDLAPKLIFKLIVRLKTHSKNNGVTIYAELPSVMLADKSLIINRYNLCAKMHLTAAVCHPVS